MDKSDKLCLFVVAFGVLYIVAHLAVACARKEVRMDKSDKLCLVMVAFGVLYIVTHLVIACARGW